MISFFRGVIIFAGVLTLFSPEVWPAQTREYVQQIQSGQFSALEEVLTATEIAREKDTDGMYVFHRVMNRISYDLAKDPESSLELLNKWCQEKDSYLSYLMRGLFYADFAWADRGAKYADKVLPEAWQSFKERLALSQQDLEKAASLNANSAEPWIALEMVYRGLGLPLKVEESFQKAVWIDKGHYNAYHMMLIARMEKWFGSHQEMFAFANQSYDEHKDDPVFALLVVEANDELAKRTALVSGGKRSDYHTIPVNYNKVKSLLDEVLKVYPRSRKALSWSATIEYFNGHYSRVLDLMDQMGDEVDEDIWGKKDTYLQTKVWLQKQHAKGVF